MRLASHNSMSYLPVFHWWMRPFRFVARCQSLTLKEQYEDCGVRMFDLRIWFDKNGTPFFCHGDMRFATGDFLSPFRYLDKKVGVFVRLVLEENGRRSKNSRAAINESLFKALCQFLAKCFPHIKFVGGLRKYDMATLFMFRNKLPDVTGKYSSTTSLFQSSSYFLRVIDDWIPLFYASKMNAKNIDDARKTMGKDDFLMLDFVKSEYNEENKG